jgi:uncharacterized protein
MIPLRPIPVTQFSLMFDGFGYGGKVEEIVLPKLTIKTEDIRAGGLDGVIVADMGLEKMEMEATLLDYDPRVIQKFGFHIGGGPTINIRGAMKREGLPAVAMSIKAQGMVTEIDMGTWKAGDKKTMKFKMVLHYYKLSEAGVDLIEIDVHMGIRNIGGIVQNADVKTALGMLATL